MLHRRGAVFLLALILLIPLSVAAQEDEGKDHPRIPRMPGYFISNANETDFDGYDFELGGDKTQRVEGRYWRIDYALKDDARRASPLEIVRNYENQARARGGRCVHQAVDPTGGSATIVMPGQGGGEVWIAIQIANSGHYYSLTIVETAAMAQKLEFTSDQMAEELARSGRVALRGILFDTGKATIKPESEPLLDEVAKLMKQDPGLNLIIEGHTDNVGQKAANLELSRRRAAAVQSALLARGVEAGRLSTTGYGDSKPVADNATEEGRARNRRVELVKKT